MKQIELNWHIVCGNIEVEELTNAGLIKPWEPRSERQALFWQIKYPEHVFYKGSWGPELLHVINEGVYRGTVGKVHCTYARYTQIANWFLISMYKA